MRVWLYSFALFLYRQTMGLAALFHPKAKLWHEGQQAVWVGLEYAFKSNIKPVAWIHTASMGEFEQGRPIIEAFKNQYPDYFILVTFYSPSGYEVRKNTPGIDFVTYLPFDGMHSSARFLDLVKPQIALFVKYEFWYFYLQGLKKRGIQTLLVSGIFRSNQSFFKWYGGFFRGMLTAFDHLFVQNTTSKELLNSIGINQVTVAGDTRFDRVLANARNSEPWDLLVKFVDNQAFVVVGSAWKADMDCIIPLINSHAFPLKWVIVPHEIHAAELNAWKSQMTVPVMFSKGEFVDQAEVLIVDEVGRLATMYRGATFGYIGGAFGAGLHNTLEAAVYGPTVFFGNKNYQKFHEAVDLVSLGLAYPVADSASLEKEMRIIFEDDDLLVNKQVMSRNYVSLQAGATTRIMDYIVQKQKIYVAQ
ncbi:MAG: Lipid 3-deoxy-D-manno-octulosonic acid transferase [Bacteroidota bacterium]